MVLTEVFKTCPFPMSAGLIVSLALYFILFFFLDPIQLLLVSGHALGHA